MEQPIRHDCHMMLSELVSHWPETIPVFFRHKMLCVGCLVNPFHTIDDACAEYGLTPAEFAHELNQAIAEAKADGSQPVVNMHVSDRGGLFADEPEETTGSLSKRK